MSLREKMERLATEEPLIKGLIGKTSADALYKALEPSIESIDADVRNIESALNDARHFKAVKASPKALSLLKEIETHLKGIEKALDALQDIE